MKTLKSLLFFSLCFYFNQNFAQQALDPGSLMIGGNAGFSLEFDKDSDNSSLFVGLNPNAASFIMENLAIGGSLNLSYSRFGEFSFTQLGVTPLVRYYFPVGPAAAVFGDARVGIQLTQQKERTFGQSESTTATNYQIGGGVAIFLDENLSLDISINYVNSSLEFIDPEIILGIGIQAFLVDHE